MWIQLLSRENVTKIKEARERERNMKGQGRKDYLKYFWNVPHSARTKFYNDNTNRILTISKREIWSFQVGEETQIEIF